MDNNIYVSAAALACGILGGTGIGYLLKNRNWRACSRLVGIDASTICGRGAFALKNIREGTIVERCPALEVTDRDVGGELLNYVFYGSDEKKRLIAMGNGMLFNHSSSPNVAYYREETQLGSELVIYALRDIRKGEEMFYNYGDEWWSTRQ